MIEQNKLVDYLSHQSLEQTFGLLFPSNCRSPIQSSKIQRTNSPVYKRGGNWVELTLVMTSGTVTEDSGKIDQ